MVLFAALGCTTATKFNVAAPVPAPPPLEADTLVHLEAIRLNGSLRTKTDFDPYGVMLDAMIASTDRVRATTDPTLADASLQVTIRGDASVKWYYYP